MTFQHKKRFGQHFLKDDEIALKIVNGFFEYSNLKNVLEIGPGEGVLTKFLVQHKEINLYISEIDRTLFELIKEKFNVDKDHFLEGDFLKLPLDNLFHEPFGVIGNFPYNISSQIVFKILDHYTIIPVCVGMFQKEVAERLAARPGSKVYGITSVLTQAYYHVEYLFTVPPTVFDPPPQVQSGVIRMIRKDNEIDYNTKLFKQIVKAGFNQRRKTLKNALKSLNLPPNWENLPYLNQRAEQLSLEQYIELTHAIENLK
jgi:16S rRNA (adenine1518-N6/adenine1519-N6)-dimethyltransferase